MSKKKKKKMYILHLKVEIQWGVCRLEQMKGGGSLSDVDDRHVQVTEHEVSVNDGLAASKRWEMEWWRVVGFGGGGRVDDGGG